MAGMFMFYSCSVTGHLRKKAPTVGLSQPSSRKTTGADTVKLPKFITFTDKDGKEKVVTEAVRDSVTGEYMTTIELTGITVVAKSKNIPERNGNINIEFVVTVPDILIDKRWALTLTPELLKGDTIIKLNDLVLSGRKFRKQQIRDYQKYEKFLSTIIPDSAAFKDKFVDMSAFQNYMERKSVEKQRRWQKEVKRELSGIKIQKNEDKRRQLIDQRNKIVKVARTNRIKNGNAKYSDGSQERKNRIEERRLLFTPSDLSSMKNELKVENSPAGQKFKDKFGHTVDDVTEYILNLKINEPEIVADSLLDESNVRFKSLTLTKDMLVNKKNIHISFSSEDSTQIMEQFILKDKLLENEKRKMKKEEKYVELVRHPYNEDARIDSIVNAQGSFRYFYSQPVPADEHTKKMILTLSGKVEAIDNSTYTLPMKDTITYYVSSMVQFLDRSPRFRKKIIERRAEANMSAYINFPVGKDIVDESLGDNEKEINKIYDLIKKITWSSEFEIDSITMTAASSPEGGFYANEDLAKRRAKSLKNFFAMKLDDKEGVDTLLMARWIAEDWKKLTGYIVNDEHIENRDGLLAIIADVKSPDAREMQIRTKYKKDYEYIKNEIYPKLRVVDFKFNLHRAGMVKDTIHTTEPDLEYASAIKMLDDRKYKQALNILIDYDDYNTAICYMSLGYDEKAYKILEKESETSDTKYLMAILAARLGREEQAVQYYLRSVELDDMKAYRGLLDPEINKLIKAYNLDNVDSLN